MRKFSASMLPYCPDIVKKDKYYRLEFKYPPFEKKEPGTV
jgi:hypothetical protein